MVTGRYNKVQRFEESSLNIGLRAAAVFLDSAACLNFYATETRCKVDELITIEYTLSQTCTPEAKGKGPIIPKM